MMQMMMIGTGKVATGQAFATWNPADRSAGVTLANGNLTASVIQAPVNGGCVRSTIGKSSGKWYWEVRAQSQYATAAIMNGSAALTFFPGNDANGYMYYVDANLYNGGSAFSPYGSAYSTGDIISVMLDMDLGSVRFWKNGVNQGLIGPPGSGSLTIQIPKLTGTWYAGTGNYTITDTIMTANFGATPFTYTPPAGFNAGLYA